MKYAFALLLLSLFGFASTVLEIDESHMMNDNVSRDHNGAAIEYVMIHFTSDFIRNPDDPYDVERNVAIFAEYGVSAHYIIDRDGNIFRLVPDERAAFHAGRTSRPEPELKNMNNRSIGIELLAVGSEADMTGEPVQFVTPEVYHAFAEQHPQHVGFTDPQYAALKHLLADLDKRHETLILDRTHVIGHDEYAPTRKSDPGELFDWGRLGLK